MTTADATVAGSFRDPCGRVFRRHGTLYRLVNPVYQDDYDRLIASGLYQTLVDAGLLVAHEEAPVDPLEDPGAYKLLRPRVVPFISYPYEWCFSQLRDAALVTLEIQKSALERGMTLKDASAYNIQFVDGRPLLIDTLSFEVQREGEPWAAYGQFCRHFLAPLALMACRDARLVRLLALHIDGVPLDLASDLLPRRTLVRPSLASHIHLHARTQRRFAGAPRAAEGRTMSRRALLGLIDSLESAIGGLRPRAAESHWSGYYGETNYSTEAFEHKQRLVAEFLEAAEPRSLWDLGANAGVFSRLAAARGIPTIAFDLDHATVEAHYLDCVRRGETRVLPLVLDLSNPSPAIGWANQERDSLAGRGPADAALALALVHHLAIGNNVPLEAIAGWLAGLCRSLIIEFVPKDDSQVKRLLASRRDIFADYHEEGFERAFARHFSTEWQAPIAGSRRTLYLLHSRERR